MNYLCVLPVSLQDERIPLPQSVEDALNVVLASPAGSHVLTLLAFIIIVVFICACFCGRMSRRIRRELKNK